MYQAIYDRSTVTCKMIFRCSSGSPWSPIYRATSRRPLVVDHTRLLQKKTQINLPHLCLQEDDAKAEEAKKAADSKEDDDDDDEAESE